MSDAYCSAVLPYMVIIRKMAHSMVMSCRECPLICVKRISTADCMEKIFAHFGVPGEKQPSGSGA